MDGEHACDDVVLGRLTPLLQAQGGGIHKLVVQLLVGALGLRLGKAGAGKGGEEA